MAVCVINFAYTTKSKKIIQDQCELNAKRKLSDNTTTDEKANSAPYTNKMISKDHLVIDTKEKPNKETLKTLKIALNQSLSELTKRFSIAIAVLSFTLMGTTFGMHIGRKRNHVLLYTAITLTTLYLVAFFVAKGVDHQFWLATSLYLTPHLIIILASLFVLRRIARGIES